MDFISGTIIAALTGLASELTDTGKKAVSQGFEKLKSLILKKFGENNQLSEAIEEMEKDPQATASAEQLAEKALQTGAHQDPDILKQVEQLKELVESHASGKFQMEIKGNAQGVVMGDNASITMNFTS